MFDHLVRNFISIYAALTQINKNHVSFFVIAIDMGEFIMLMLQKYGYKVLVISFGSYSTHYKLYLNLPCINTQLQTTAPVDTTHVI